MSPRAIRSLLLMALLTTACGGDDSDPATTTGDDDAMTSTDPTTGTAETVATTVSTTEGSTTGMQDDSSSSEGGEVGTVTGSGTGTSDGSGSESSSTSGVVGATSGSDTGEPLIPCEEEFAFLYDEDAFDSFVGGPVALEGFTFAGFIEDTRGAPGPWSVATDDDIWSPGDIVAGMTILGGDDGLQIVRGHLFGRDRPATVAAGTAAFDNHVTLRFSPPVRAVAFTLSQEDAGLVGISANSTTSGQVGAGLLALGDSTEFFGVCSPEPIDEVSIQGAPGNVTVFDDVRFGSPQ